ncbi:MAG: amino acid ABC transporter permease [Pseudoclavibacter sp.]
MSFGTMVATLLGGLWNSLTVSVVAAALAVIGGLLLAIPVSFRTPVLSQIIRCYVNVIRCTPLIVQIALIFVGLPDVGIKLTPFGAGVAALALWGGGYLIEVFRSGFQAVDRDQVVAARALGMSASGAFMHVVLPLGIRVSWPAMTTVLLTLFRSSSFLIIVGYAELTFVANKIVSDTFEVFKVFGMAALLYLIVSVLTGLAARWFEHRNGWASARTAG